MLNLQNQKEIDQFSQFEDIGASIKTIISASIGNPELIGEMDIQTIKNLKMLNLNTDTLIQTISRMQQYFNMITLLSKEELRDLDRTDQDNSVPVNNERLMNRMVDKANATVSFLSSEIIAFQESYSRLEQNKKMVPELVNLMDVFIAKILTVFENLTSEAQETYNRIKTKRADTIQPKTIRFNFNRN